MARCLFSLMSVILLAACASTPALSTKPQLTETANKVEKTLQAKLGLLTLNTRTGEVWEHRADETFLMCSTFKLLLAAQTLKRVDEKTEALDRSVRFSKKDVLSYAPVVQANLKKSSISVRELAAAAVQVSDNSAANLLLRDQGGPRGLTQFLRELGDAKTRLDRFEPELNVESGELDTTTPRAMVATLQKILLGPVLSESSRQLLLEWLLTNTTSARRIKAGLPPDWKVADKTGTGGTNHVNDIGIILSPDQTPIVFSVFVSGSSKNVAETESAIATLGREIAKTFR